MRFALTRAGRRARALDEPFPEGWRRLLRDRLAHWSMLTGDERNRLEDYIKVFIVDKKWQAANGFELTDEIKVLISTMACLLIIEVHPTTVVRTGLRATGVSGVVTDSPFPILGEASFEGPVVIAWDAANANARHPEHGHNVVYHEFAHKLDMSDRLVDGTPRFAAEASRQRWIAVCTAEFEAVRHGESGDLLDPYAGVNPAEFFAVVTEVFFDRPSRMQTEKPDLYGVLQAFYRQDTAARERAAG
jgi:Mlc titration factor MtfA (ptsG expression regulator)